jgi:hypothetical protein
VPKAILNQDSQSLSDLVKSKGSSQVPTNVSVTKRTDVKEMDLMSPMQSFRNRNYVDASTQPLNSVDFGNPKDESNADGNPSMFTLISINCDPISSKTPAGQSKHRMELVDDDHIQNFHLHT